MWDGHIQIWVVSLSIFVLFLVDAAGKRWRFFFFWVMRHGLVVMGVRNWIGWAYRCIYLVAIRVMGASGELIFRYEINVFLIEMILLWRRGAVKVGS